MPRSPIVEGNKLKTSLDTLDLFDLCLVINCKIYLDIGIIDELV